MSISSIKGAMLEEVILHLLEKMGYSVIREKNGDSQLHDGSSGLEIQGRGSFHQVDALAQQTATLPFVYPLRLIVEAKCYKLTHRIGIDVVRNLVGVLKDVSENHVHYSLPRMGNVVDGNGRFNYVGAIFSTSGFTSGAARYALAHQVFLIQYKGNHNFQPISDILQEFDDDCFLNSEQNHRGSSSKVRAVLRSVLRGEDYRENIFSENGMQRVREISVVTSRIGGSYFGMLQGRWLLSNSPIPSSHIINSDEIQCKVYGFQSTRWSFVPLDGAEGDADWFRLDFDLPAEIAELVQNSWDDRVEVANLKRQHFSFIYISGIFDGIRRQIKLTLSEDWITDYINRYGGTT
jgi:hypothetical protein